MKRILEDLYAGNIQPYTKEFNDKIYQSNRKTVMDLETELLKNLRDENLKKFENLSITQEDLNLFLSKENFIEGFRLGMRIAIESIYENAPKNFERVST